MILIVDSVFMSLISVRGTAGVPRLWHNFAMSGNDSKNKADAEESKADDTSLPANKPPKEIGGRSGLDPTRYGDWEKAGRCVDF